MSAAIDAVNVRATDTRDSLERGVRYLLRAQHPAGSWSDFWLPVGASDAWVTAYVGLALDAAASCMLLDAATRELAATAAGRAAAWLLARRRPGQGWGYNMTVRADADSTAHVLSLLARVGAGVPAEAVAFLRAHLAPGFGFRTYLRHDRSHQWGRPCIDVTAAALRALHDVGEMSGAELAAAWGDLLGPAQDERGWWYGYWWSGPAYATGLALEVWRVAGRPVLLRPVDRLPSTCAFDTAWAHTAGIDLGAAHTETAGELLASQEADGGWPSAPILRVPPSHERAGHAMRTVVARDARRLFVTASAVRALAFVEPDAARAPAFVEPAARPPSTTDRRVPAPRSPLGEALDRQIALAAQALGFDAVAANEAQAMYAALTAETLAEPCPWPAEQLSSLAAGTPLEYSVAVGARMRPALRYATEVGRPLLAPHARARSGVAAVARAAALLGYDRAWERVAPGVQRLVAAETPVPDGLRFWVWSGIDQAVAGDDGLPGKPELKIYLNLLHAELGGGRERLEDALQAASFPISASLRRALDMLDSAGFAQQFGFGLGPDGRVACKFYYELNGWRRVLVSRLLGLAGFADLSASLCPEIPGILRETLAAKSRAGISLRIDPLSGSVDELTTTAAFPMAMLPAEETCRRVGAWIDRQGGNAEPYYALAGLLLPDWEHANARLVLLHSLFTRTVGRDGAWATVYLRPYIAPAIPAEPAASSAGSAAQPLRQRRRS